MFADNCMLNTPLYSLGS